MAKHNQKPVSVEWACKTLNKWGFHVRDQGDKLICFHTTKMFDAEINVEDGVPDRHRLDQLIDRFRNNRVQPLHNATGGFASDPRMSKPITIRETA